MGGAGGGATWTVPQLGKSSIALSVNGLNFIILILYDLRGLDLPCAFGCPPFFVRLVRYRGHNSDLSCQLLKGRLCPCEAQGLGACEDGESGNADQLPVRAGEGEGLQG